jgi:hypothetical protein
LAVSGSNIIAGTGNYTGGTGGIYLSTDNGASWINKNQGFDNIPEVTSLTITNDYIFAGTYQNSVWRRSLPEMITSVERLSTDLSMHFSLDQNYPNPFNPSTTINYSVAKEGNVKLTVYNVIGSKIATIVNEYKPGGSYSVQFNGSNLASGIYLYRLESGNYSAAKKFILMK